MEQRRLWSLAGAGVLALACNAVLGLEEKQLADSAGGGREAGSAGASGTAGTAGTRAGNGGATPGAGGSSGEPGATLPNAGASAEGGESNGGSGAEAGTEPGPSAGGSSAGGAGEGEGGSATSEAGAAGAGGEDPGPIDCPAGQYVEATNPSNNARTCRPCPAGTFSTATNAASCSACTPGTYSAGPGATECLIWRVCDPGTYVSSPGSVTDNQMCDECPGNTQSTLPNQSQCLAPDACPAGTEQTAPATESMPATCEDCETGSYCPGGDTPQVTCAEGTWDHDGAPSTACTSWTNCPTGTEVNDDGGPASDRTCTGCASGSFTDTVNATSCELWRDCGPGSRVSANGSLIADRACAACTSGTFSTTTNATSCTNWTPCSAGSYILGSGTTSRDQTCSLCSAGTYSSGSNAASCATCTSGTFAASSGATGCASWSSCSAGSRINFAGSTTADRTCTTCSAGTYTSASNAASCTTCASGTFAASSGATSCAPWRTCGGWADLQTQGTTTTNATCVTGSEYRQFGTGSSVEINAATPDASGNLYVAGDVSGSLPGQTSAGNRDAFVRKYDANGSVVLTWQFGGTSNDTALGIAVDAAGAVYVTGYTMGTLPGLTSAGGWDTYVRKFNANGTVAWTRQLGSVTNDVSYAVAVDGAGGVYITGYAGDPLPGQMAYGSQDIFVHKYDASGNVAWTRQYGPTMHSSGRAIAIDANNNIYVTGYSYGALPGQASSGNADPFIRKYDQSGNTIWTTQFAYGYGEGIGIDATGNLYLVGYGGLAGQQSAGGWDIFVRKFSGDASVLWTRQFGTSASDAVPTIGVNASGDVAVTGRVSTAYHGQTHAGLEDVYVRKFNASGTELWNTQFGTAADEIPFAAAIDPAGNVYSAGWTGGALPGQTLTGSQDAFVVQVIPP